MPSENPEALRKAGRKWLTDNTNKRQLRRPVILVPGICNETSAMWDTLDSWGAKVFTNWQRTRVAFPLPQTSTLMNFVDLGSATRDAIAAAVGTSAYDLVCYSMGGLDAFAALVPLTGGTIPNSATPIADPGTWVTLDTPFFGVENWQMRKTFPDMFDPNGQPWPSRTAQCEALAPMSPQLVALRNARVQLAGRVGRLTCYCCMTGDDVVMVGKNGDLCQDTNPDENSNPTPVWNAPPDYSVYDVPGTTHAGAGAIYDNEWAVASAFADLIEGP